MELLRLPNVTLYGSLSNSNVIELMERSHFLLLPTVHDTYGYSPLEAMSLGVPVIASATAAIPEFVKDGENGFLLPMENDDVGDWVHLRQPPLQWPDLDLLYDQLADAAIERLTRVLHCPDLWGQLSHGALTHVVRHHDSVTIGAHLEQLYSAALEPAYAGNRNSRNGATRCAHAASSWVPPSTRM
jgi:glycosyltransferase involved in cell wall biosynthesis